MITTPFPAAYAHSDAHLFRIGLAPISLDAWFEGSANVDGDPAIRKAQTFTDHPDMCWGATDRSRPGQVEVWSMMADHFGVDVTANADIPPLRRAAGLVDDDLCLMEQVDGAWVLTAASLCAPSFFHAGEVIGKSLGQLHDPVSGFGDKLLGRVSRIFDALKPDQIVERRNWSVVASGDLFLPDSKPVRADQASIMAADAGSALFVRMERQTLRRLPKTGGILFTIRIWRHDLNWLHAHPTRLHAFEMAWDQVMGDAGQTFRDYKGLGPLDPLVRKFLASTRD